ncbi:FAD-dependent oxidoreductase [Dictyobacter arantiisoli]|uniref:N-methyl-L-tryptophan oxidase n=1 Tax=Dictyobacter arantiisoli TaxID=2014874 RepID=A0A5A5T6U5_9CHLR|nr:FAD-dependent oxidoreductase [Dictyobacter arantiisoli]GCF07098.1 N-methyl-L-tryptophan oxidase [Dictyobacter arantiisoli]
MNQQRIIIVGGGILGLATAYNLLMQGFIRVTVLEQATIDHDRGSSHGSSRLLRFEYGNDTLYTGMVNLSLERWKKLEQQTQRHLYTPTGVLVLGHENDNFARPGYDTVRKLGYAPERLTHAASAQRFPQFNTADYDFISYNMDAGMMHASTCLKVLRDCIIDMGGTIQERQRVTSIEHEDLLKPIRLLLANGDTIEADRVIVAAGPWVHRLLGKMELPVRLTHQYLLYFANLPASLYGVNACPAFIAGDLYGFPMHQITENGPSWFKAASHEFGAPADPDEPPHIDQQAIKQVVERLYHLIPALQQADLTQIEAFMYDVSIDEDFILDYMPNDKRIILGTGLSGHAFKFGILLGELVSSLVSEEEPVVPMTRFKLSRFAAHQNEHSHSIA